MTTKFLQSATGNHNPDYETVHGNLAADGYRIHRDNSLAPVQDDFTERATPIIPVRPRNRATVSRVDLIIACKRSLALRTEWDRRNKVTFPLTFSMNGSFSYKASSEETGSISAEIVNGEKVVDKIKSVKNGLKYETHQMVYNHHFNSEREVTFSLNPRYLLDALEGMEGDTVEIDIPVSNAPFYMTDGTREAVIMPVSL